MEFSFGVLGIFPNVFWSMTMKEFLSACRGHEKTLPKKDLNEPISKTKFEQMMSMFPDKT